MEENLNGTDYYYTVYFLYEGLEYQISFLSSFKIDDQSSKRELWDLVEPEIQIRLKDVPKRKVPKTEKEIPSYPYDVRVEGQGLKLFLGDKDNYDTPVKVLFNRREAFKQTAKMVLPFLGMMMLPSSARAILNEEIRESVSTGCKIGCYGGCTDVCTGGCSRACKGCTGLCIMACRDDCYANCYGSCGRGCGSLCSNDCEIVCSATCLGSCSGYCSTSCTGTMALF